MAYKNKENLIKWRSRNTEKIKKWMRDYHLKKKYGITIEQWQAMHDAQNGLCYLCGRPPNGQYKTLNVDHCHTTGRVRGLLCYSCNIVLGHIESIGIEKVANYLIRVPEVPEVK